MNNISCNTYRKFYFRNTSYPIAKEVWDTEEYHQWVKHPHEWKKCNDWNLKQELKKLSISLRGFPCVHLAYFSSIRCKQHTTPYECPDVIILKFDKFNEYSLKMGSTDSVIIQYCPWCGKHLPQSKRQKWFKEVEALGFEPGDKRIQKNMILQHGIQKEQSLSSVITYLAPVTKIHFNPKIPHISTKRW